MRRPERIASPRARKLDSFLKASGNPGGHKFQAVQRRGPLFWKPERRKEVQTSRFVRVLPRPLISRGEEGGGLGRHEEPCLVTMWKEADLRAYEGHLHRPPRVRRGTKRIM